MAPLLRLVGGNSPPDVYVRSLLCAIYAKNSLYFWIFLAFHLSCVSAQRPACVITMEHGESVSSCDIVTERVWWGLATHCSKANKQTRLVERKVCFISDAGNWGEGWNAWQKSAK